MNCITDFLPDDTSEHNADGENMDEIVFGGKPAALKQVTWDDLTKELQHALLATSRDEEINFVEAEYLYDNGLIAYKPPTMIGVSRYRLTPTGRAILPMDALAIERALADASVEAHAETLERVQALEAENARLKAALEWYADAANYVENWTSTSVYCPDSSDAQRDEGERARKALKPE